MIKTPGILYRLSFLVVFNSLFIFAAVTVVSVDNNQAKIDRLINYRFDFISDYFRAELERHCPVIDDSPAFARMDEEILNTVFDNARKCMKGLGSLALLTPTEEGDDYIIKTVSFRESLDKYDPRLWEYITNEADRKTLDAQNIQVGNRYEGKAGAMKTIYIPWIPSNTEAILAITYIPDEIVGGDYFYNWTLIVLFLVITLITLLIINLIFRNFIRPLNHLVKGMEKTAEGDVVYRIEDVANDEVGRVAAAFNTMSTILADKHKQLTDTLDELSLANCSLAESKAFLSRLIENAPFAVIATDPDRHILVFSKAATATFGIRVDEAVGRDIIEFFPFAPEKVFPDDGENDGNVQDEMICRKPNGDSFPALVSKIPIHDTPPHIRAYLFIIRDISESAGFQEMMISIDRMATRGVMAGEIAHEINNYLAIILGNVELVPLLLARGKMDKVDRKLEILRETVTKIQRFSEGLMGYGNEAAVFEPGDLNQLIENLVTFLKPQNRYDNIRFSMALSPRMPLVEFDSSQLQQLLVNLLNNAADALREKKDDREINITTGIEDESQNVRITIEDNAAGLPDDIHDSIFVKRYTGNRRGRGFGLVIVKRITDKHCGRISYTTVPAKGTSFMITLPVKAKAIIIDNATPESSQVTT
jgi:PAS domain S-box-containing protein